MGETRNEVEPNNTFGEATPIVEGLNGSLSDDSGDLSAQVRGDNNIVIDANFSSDGDVDYYAFNMKITKWYSFNTTNSSVAEDGDIMLELYSRDDPGTNLIDDSVEGGYGSEDFRLSGWSPPVDGIYILKVSPAPGSVGGANTGDYQLRMGYATWRLASLEGEPDNDQQGSAVEVGYDSSNTYAAIYPAGDEDWFSFSGSAGDIIHVETFSGLDWDGTWYRDLDTEITLVDPSGNVVENDDYVGINEDNQFSGIVDYTLQGDGLVYVKVNGYNDDDEDDGDNAIGTYRLFVYSSAAAPAFLEPEPNNTFAGAMQIPEGKDVISTFSSAADIDVFAFDMVTLRMYFVNSKDNTTAEDIHAEFFAASDTQTDLLDSDIDGRYENHNFRLSGFIPPADGVYYMKLSCTNPGQGGYTIRARSADIAEVSSFHEPDNTINEADALGDYPIDGVTMTGALYNKNDAEFEHDLDIYRFSCTAGQMFVAETAPVGGPTWHRDTETFIQLVNAAGDTIAESDDVVIGNSFSTLAVTIPADGVYYIKIMPYYSSHHGGREATHRDPGLGDYLLTVKGTMSESEPNNSAAEANLIPVANNNLIEASFATDDLEDWFKIALEQGKLYYFNSTDSKVAEDIKIEVFAEGSQTNIIADGDPFDRYDSNDFNLSGWSPPATGTYLFKLSVPISAIDPNNTGEYKLRAAGGEVLAEVALLHEPDNSMAQADLQAALSTDGTPFETAFGDKDDHDMFAINGIEGNSLEIVTAPAHGPRWIRDLDTVMNFLSPDSTVLDDNDDYDDWYQENFYQGEVDNVYSRIFIESLPATGTYYIDVFPYRGSYNEEEPADGKNAVGSYLIWAKMSTITGINETEQVPKVFALEQNYPNPFNPTTTIQYSLREPVHVKLVIYNIIGQKVTTLVDEPQMSGYHKIIWDTKNEFGVSVSTGIYIYRLIAGDKFIKTKKMLLIK